MTSFTFTLRIHQLTNGRYPIEASASDGSHTRWPTNQLVTKFEFNVEGEIL